MDDVKVLFYVESRYKANRKLIKSTILSILKEQGVKSKTEVSVAVVGDRKMKSLNKKYRDIDKTTNVLSFPLWDNGKDYQPEEIVKLGDIVISFPQVIREAAEGEILVDDKIDELIRHSMLHLLGIHHQ